MENTSGVSRRKVVSGIAWSVPAVTAVAVAPFAAASPTCDPATAWLNWLSSSAAPAGNSGVTVGYDPMEKQFILSGYGESAPSSYVGGFFDVRTSYAALITYVDGSTSTVGSWPLSTENDFSEEGYTPGQEIVITGEATQSLDQVVSITVAGFTHVSYLDNDYNPQEEVDQNLTEYTLNSTTCTMSGVNNFRVYNDVCDPAAVWENAINDNAIFIDPETGEVKDIATTTYSNGVFTLNLNPDLTSASIEIRDNEGNVLYEEIKDGAFATALDLISFNTIRVSYSSEEGDATIGSTLGYNCVLGPAMAIHG